jgi:hypothetical protein
MLKTLGFQTFRSGALGAKPRGKFRILGIKLYMKKRTHMLAGMFVASAIIATSVPYALASSNDSMTLCIKNSGATFVVGEGFKKGDCKKNEQLVTVFLHAGVTGPQGPADNKGPLGNKGPQGDQ